MDYGQIINLQSVGHLALRMPWVFDDRWYLGGITVYLEIEGLEEVVRGV
jgi:hypothetical protein